MTSATPSWHSPTPSLVERAARTLRRWLGGGTRRRPEGLPDLPGALRRGVEAGAYLAAARDADHRRAGAAAMVAAEVAVAASDWWAADTWAHRALWHFERAESTLHAIRAARLIGEVRSAAGDPASARRYYAEAIDEARDIGAEREQGLASLGLGRAWLDLGDVTTARRLARGAVELLVRAGAPAGEVDAARDLLGIERAVTTPAAPPPVRGAGRERS